MSRESLRTAYRVLGFDEARETDVEDGFREPVLSEERRLEPQIAIGLLADAAGFSLAVQARRGA